jgi:signal transduction histidine kinase
MRLHAERWLPGIGLAIWLFVGTPTLWRFAHHPDELAAARSLAWLACYLGFAVALWLTTRSATLAIRRAALLAQTVAALGLLFVGMPEFEGALLAVVAAQTPALFPWPIAVAWAAAQAVPLLAVIYPSHRLLGSLQAVGAYLAFSAFAFAAAYLQQREVSARLDLGRLNAELIATQQMLADSTRMSERLRISGDLHDALGHHLIALGLQLNLGERTEDAVDSLAKSKAIVANMLADVRQVVGGLRQEAGIDVGQALRTLAESVPAPRVHLDLPETLDPVDPERAQALFRCVQEALTNSVKHGDARNLWVRVVRSEGGLDITVRDDGRGASSVAFGNGLAGMRHRLAQLGGELAVQSQPGRGFELHASIPAAEGAA